MNPLIKDLIAYLTEIFGLRIDVHLIPPKNTPLFINELYSFCSLRVGTTKFLGVLIHDPEKFRPSVLGKHQRYFPIQAGEDRGYKGYVLIAAHLPGFVRKKLIEMKAPFVVAKVQLYWPELGLEFKSHSRHRAAHEIVQNFDPVTQAVLIGALNGLYQDSVTPKELSEKLHYSAMSMTRALDQIEAIDIGQVVKTGKKRFLTFSESTKAIWEKVRPMLKSPVRDTYRLAEEDMPEHSKLLAGESALSEMSLLVAPRTATYAVGREKWKGLQEKIIPGLIIDEPGTCAVQVWRYDPELFSKRGCVDIFSLYLSLEYEKDERVESSLLAALEAQL